MAYQFSEIEADKLSETLIYLRGAYELPFDATVIERVADVAVSSGFVSTNSEFAERVKDRPITTLLEFVAFVGAP